MTFKGVIFDADGTLLDSIWIWDQVTVRYLNKINITPEEGLAKKISNMSITEGCTFVKEKYNIDKSVDTIKSEVKGELSDFYKNEVLLKPGIEEFVRKLKEKNVPMIVATTWYKNLVRDALKSYGLDSFFVDIIDCSIYDTNKREGKIYRIAAKKLGLEPAEVAVFEDAVYAVNSAVDAGFKVYGVYDKDQEENEEEIRKKAYRYIKDYDFMKYINDFK